MGDVAIRVLVVEDHQALAEWLVTELTHVGWAPSCTGTFAGALRMAKESIWDTVLIDIGLPDGDGVELCRQLRRTTAAGLIVLTARDGLPNRVRALELGADDFLAKPFAIEELTARIRAVQRRLKGDAAPVIEIGDLRLWLEERRAESGGRTIPLGKREYCLLKTFMRHPRQVLSRDQLLDHVWGYEFEGGSNVVDVTVKRLRQRLAALSTVTVVAVRGVGYVLRADQTPAEDA